MRRRGESRCVKVKSIPTEEEISKEVTVFFFLPLFFSFLSPDCASWELLGSLCIKISRLLF